MASRRDFFLSTKCSAGTCLPFVPSARLVGSYEKVRFGCSIGTHCASATNWNTLLDSLIVGIFKSSNRGQIIYRDSANFG
jgi:hypothetical protein